jgi:hypothetical protein
MTLVSSGDTITQIPIPEGIIQAARSLPYNPRRYFLIDVGTITLPITVLVQTRARDTGIRNALELMKLAYEGQQAPRAPLTVQAWKGNYYLVLDGNSTLAIARAAGWADVPCQISRLSAAND